MRPELKGKELLIVYETVNEDKDCLTWSISWRQDKGSPGNWAVFLPKLRSPSVKALRNVAN